MRDDLVELINLAQEAALHAYAPYSKFRVGAALRAGHKTYTGANVENASFGLSLCAERAALCAAVNAGDTRISAIAVACIDATSSTKPGSLMPCGACRQWIAELASDAVIVVAGVEKEFLIRDLLPAAFRL